MPNRSLACALLSLLALVWGAATAREPDPVLPIPEGTAGVPAKLALIAVLAEQSGLTHVLNSDPKLGNIRMPRLSPLADLDGDGHLDICWYDQGESGAAVWLGRGDGTFRFDASGYASRWIFGTRDPLWWDFTGDGKLDALGTEGAAKGCLFVNAGTGHWKKSATSIPIDRTGHALTWMLADLDGDGHHDEAWYSGHARSIRPRLREWGLQPPERLDLATLWDLEQVIKCSTGFKPDAWPTYGPCVFSVDLDGDGQNEVLASFSSNMVGGALSAWVLKRDPAQKEHLGWRECTAGIGLPAEEGHWFYPEDLDVDGNLDILDLSTGHWFVNDGKGRFTCSPQRMYDPALRRGKNGGTGTPWDGDGALELLDLDNDGRRDLVFGSNHTSAGGVFLNRGQGHFEEVASIPLSRYVRKFGDVDSDGDLDLLQEDPERVRMLKLLRNATPNLGLHLKCVPKARAEADLGCSLWVYQAGHLGDMKRLIHYRQSFMERRPSRSVVIDRLHIGLGKAEAVDIRVRFPSGVIRESKGVKARTTVEVREEGE